MTKQRKKGKFQLTQWHPAFCAAVQLELIGNKGQLAYRLEHGLNTRPIQIDLLVIVKSPEIEVKNEIGHIFRGHNLFEYKSPNDQMTIDTFSKALAYAFLYKSSAEQVDMIKMDDMTVSLVREGYPRKLFSDLQDMGFCARKAADGIYRVGNVMGVEIQIIVSRELDEKNHVWLKALTQSLTRREAERLICDCGNLSRKDEKDLVSSVLQVAIRENKAVFLGVKEASGMCEALRELMKPEMDKAIRDAVAEKAAALAEKDVEIAEKATEIAEKDAEIRELRRQLAALNA